MFASIFTEIIFINELPLSDRDVYAAGKTVLTLVQNFEIDYQIDVLHNKKVYRILNFIE